MREKRDLELEKLKDRYASKTATQQERIRRAEERIDREKSQSKQQMMNTAISFGTSLLGALMGNKLASKTNVSKMGTSARSAGRISKEREDVARAEENLAAEQEKLQKLQRAFEEDVAEIEEKLDAEKLELDELTVKPKKSDIDVESVRLVWTPWHVDPAGIAEPAW